MNDKPWYEYVLFVDEAGDAGIRTAAQGDKGSTEWFAMGGFVTSRENEAQITDWVRQVRQAAGASDGLELHYNTLDAESARLRRGAASRALPIPTPPARLATNPVYISVELGDRRRRLLGPLPCLCRHRLANLRRLAMRPLDPTITALPKTDFQPGPAPMLSWIKTDRFVVDDTYQREIGKRGRLNILYIAENFDWSKFAPVIVAPVEGGRYAIVDGQHRTTAAMLRGIEEVPCQIVQADRAQQAAAYAAVNGNVTKTTPHQLFHAKLAAGDLEATELDEVCRAGGVKVLRRNIITAKMAVGETQAVGALARCLSNFGRSTLITALQCLTETADGNAGYVRATIVEGYCEALHRTPWVDMGEQLLRAMDDFCVVDMWGEITDGRDQIFPATVRRLVTERVVAHLRRKLPIDTAPPTQLSSPQVAARALVH